MPSIEELRSQQRDIMRQLRDAEDLKRQAEMSAMVGRFFKHRNSYSCPEKSSDYWWLYGAYRRIGKRVFSVRFQTDRDGKFEIEQREEIYPYSGWQEITRKEYFTALRKAESLIAKFHADAQKESR